MAIPNLTPAKTLDELEHNVYAIEQYQSICAQVDENRRKALALPIPRNTCPGCFSAIYYGAAEQGWCCDCFSKRKHYEQDARLPAFAPRPERITATGRTE